MSNANSRTVPPRRLWWLGAGFVVWCSALCALYAVHAIGCAFAWSGGGLRTTLFGVLVMHLLVVGWMWRNFARSGPDPLFSPTGAFLHVAIFWVTIAAFVSTVLVLAPPLLLTPCL